MAARRALIGIAVVALLAAGCQEDKASQLTAREAKAVAGVEDVLRRMVADDGFGGAVLVAKGDRVLFGRAYGLADRKTDVRNTLGTRFRIGSMNKMFTAVAILQLVEAGKVELTAPLGRYLTGYPSPDVATKVTIHHLLTHTGEPGTSSAPTSTRTAPSFTSSLTT